MRNWIAGLMLSGMVTVPAGAAEKIERFYGYAYDLKSNAYLYTEVHEQRLSGDKWTGGAIRYFLADGSPLGNKTLDFSRNEFVPVYRLTLDYGYSEGISAVDGGKVEMFNQPSRSAKLKRKTAELGADMAADSGFHSYLRAHFDELMQGKVLPLRLAVAGDLDTYRFRGRKTGETRFEGKPAVQVQVEADSALLRLVAPSLVLTYEPGRKHLLEYRGPSNIHDPKTGEIYTVRIAYYSTPPKDAPKLPPLQ